MNPDKAEVLQHVIRAFTAKVQKGIEEHGEDADLIKNLPELEAELYDGLFYVVNAQRILRKVLTHLEAGDLHGARELLQQQLEGL